MLCRGNRLDRRSFLAAGCAGLGLSLVDLLHLQQAYPSQSAHVPHKSAATSVIHIFLPGGIPHQDTFDPKPYAPIEYRGDLGVVGTSTGEYLSGALPASAAIAEKLVVIRSMTHTEAAHERGTHQMFTGYMPSPALVYPSVGSVVSHEFGARNNLPPYVCIPSVPNEFAGGGYLPSAFSPFSLGADPAAGDFRVRDLDLPPGVTPERALRRREALQEVNRTFLAQADDDGVAAMSTFYERAFSLLDSAEARAAFDINREPEEVRNRYGRHEAGQRMLLARRLVAAGVRLVTLTYGSWDLHNQVAAGIRGQMPAFDQAFSALLTDLDQTGLLAETLVMVSSEFGRTPKINGTAGRDHWPRVFSVVVAGGGLKRGLVYGASDATAAEPDRDPVSPADLMATLYHQLGIDPEKELIAPGNRPIEIVKGGRILHDLIA
jgi:hypothetical protein